MAFKQIHACFAPIFQSPLHHPPNPFCYLTCLVFAGSWPAVLLGEGSITTRSSLMSVSKSVLMRPRLLSCGRAVVCTAAQKSCTSQSTSSLLSVTWSTKPWEPSWIFLKVLFISIVGTFLQEDSPKLYRQPNLRVLLF